MGWLAGIYRWCLTNGVEGNLAASAITWSTAFVAGVLVGRRKLRPHLKNLSELHRLMHHVHADKAAELGHTVSPTEGRR